MCRKLWGNCGGYFPHLLISYRQRLHCSTQSVTGGVRVTCGHLNRRVTENRRYLKSIGPSISEPSGRSVAKIVETKVRNLGFDASVGERALHVIDRKHLIALSLLANRGKSFPYCRVHRDDP